MPIIDLVKVYLNDAPKPVVSSSYGEFEPGHTSNDFVISADGVLKKYQGTRYHVIIPKNVKSIGEGAFQGQWIKSVTIPTSVKHVGKRAFYNCSSLTSIFFEENKSANNYGSGFFALGVNHSYLTIDEEAFALPPFKVTDRCILLARHLKNVASNAFSNSGKNEFLVYARWESYYTILTSDKDFNHLHPYFDDQDVEEYIAKYAEYKEKEYLFQIAPTNRKIKNIQQGKLKETIQSRERFVRVLAQKTGFFQMMERKNCKERIAKLDEELAVLNGEIHELESKLALAAQKRDEAIEKMKALPSTEQLQLAKKELEDYFYRRKENQRKNYELCMKIMHEERLREARSISKNTQNSPVPSSTCNTAMPFELLNNDSPQQTIPVTSSACYTDSLNYGTTEQDRTFTGNQMEDYGKLREKILSGDVSTSELQEFEIKWGYLP